MNKDDQRIREFAYQIWESEGQPEGQQDRHWDMAHKLAQAQALAPSNPEPRKTKAKAKTASGAAPKAVEKPAAAKKPRAARKPAAP